MERKQVPTGSRPPSSLMGRQLYRGAQARMDALCALTVAPNHCRDLYSMGSGFSVPLPPKSLGWLRVPMWSKSMGVQSVLGGHGQ